MHSSFTHPGAPRRVAGIGRLLCAGAAAMLLGSAAIAQTAAVDINTASAEQLASSIGGVGAAKAQAIVEYRDHYGAFESVDDLIDVPGIGLRTLERNRDVLRVDAPMVDAGSESEQAAVTQ